MIQIVIYLKKRHFSRDTAFHGPMSQEKIKDIIKSNLPNNIKENSMILWTIQVLER